MTRVLTLLLVTQVTAEWVEISQQHYRKPLRTHSTFTTPDKVVDFEDSTKPWASSNRTVTEYNWNKNLARPSIGNVKRVQHIGNTVKSTEIIKLEDEDSDLDVDVIDYEVRPNYGPTKATLKLHEHGKQKGTIERVTNVGNIKRVQLNESPVKSPTVLSKGDREKYSNTQYENHHTKANEFEHEKNTELSNRRMYVNKVQQHYDTYTPATYPLGEDLFTAEVNNFSTKRTKQEYKNATNTAKPTFINKDFSNYESQRNRFQKITNSKSSEATENMNALTTDVINADENIITKTNMKLTKSTTEIAPKSNVHINVNDFQAESSYENKVNVFRNDEKEPNLMISDYKSNTNAQLVEEVPLKDEHEKKKVEKLKGKDDETLNSTKKGKIKVNTMENVIKFMKVVAETISRNSRRSFGGKMQYLHELKDSILANIEERIDATWPDDDSPSARRRSRSAHASARGHVQFPSSESALMTISFLTFAVFLIKLVLQVIQTYKHKAMMVAPLMVASGRNVFANHGHH